MTERDYFNLKLEALSWLMGFRQDHPDFTFRFARRTRTDLFQGASDRPVPYFYVEVAERAGNNGRYYVNFEFQLDNQNVSIKKVVISVKWRDDDGNINLEYQRFAQNIGLNINNGSGSRSFEDADQDALRRIFMGWLENNYQTIVDSLNGAILSRTDFDNIWQETKQVLIGRNIINQDPVEGRYRLTDTAFQGNDGADAPGDAHNDENQVNGINNDMIERVKQLVESNLQVILTGAPGTGKTFTAKQVAYAITGDNENTPEEESHVKSVQFHPGYDYSDFVIGLKLDDRGNEVDVDQDGNGAANGNVHVSFRWKDGIFKDFAQKAKRAYDAAVHAGGEVPKFVFLIDEINRADLSRVFGELFSLLEEDYRYRIREGVHENVHGITLPSGEKFVIPENLYIIGTMNDIDRSVESMDFALRRRFAWREVSAEESSCIIEAKIIDEDVRRRLQTAMHNINEKIADQNLRLGTEYKLGGAIFAKYMKYVDCPDAFERLWENHIYTILNEYLRGRRDKKEKLDGLKVVYDKAVQVHPLAPEEAPLQA